MSCQILKSLISIGGEVASDPFIAAAIKYGADNGAVISQNSWGYAATRAGRNASSYINPVHKEAIDYFIKYAGCDNKGEQLDGSPMKGGIVLFASGNANTSDPRIAAPADYERLLRLQPLRPIIGKLLIPIMALIRIFLLPADRWMETDGFGARLRNDPIIMNTWLVHRWRARWSVV